ncbi:PREDICTED: uncharacterized protein LOC104165758, partial [Cariama cristata]
NDSEEIKKEAMFSFFRKSQDSKKVTVPEREADGFVIVGRTIMLKREKRLMKYAQHMQLVLKKFELKQCEGAASAGGSTRQVSLQPSEGAKRAEAWAETSLMSGVDPRYLNRDNRAGVVMMTGINTGHQSQLTVSSAEVGNERSQNLESSPFMSDLLNDVPFALAPHVLAVQGTHSDVPDRLLTYDINDNLSRFWYDFTLENSVLCDL